MWSSLPKKYKQAPTLKINATKSPKKVSEGMVLWKVEKARPGNVFLAKLVMIKCNRRYIYPIHLEGFKEGKEKYIMFHLDQLNSRWHQRVICMNANLMKRMREHQSRIAPNDTAQWMLVLPVMRNMVTKEHWNMHYPEAWELHGWELGSTWGNHFHQKGWWLRQFDQETTAFIWLDFHRPINLYDSFQLLHRRKCGSARCLQVETERHLPFQWKLCKCAITKFLFPIGESENSVW